MAARIVKGDNVIVTAGKDKGRQGKVLKVLRTEDKVVVEGINRVTKHVRPSQTSPQGGKITKDAPIHVSNVMPIDPSSGKPTRIKFEERDGVKHRVAVKSGESLGVVGKKA